MEKINKFIKKAFIATRLPYLWSIKTELLLGAIATLIFFKIMGFLQSLGFTVAGLDEGIIHFAFLGVIIVTFGVIIAFTVVNFAFGTIDSYIDNNDEKDDAKSEDEKISFSRDWKAAPPSVRILTAVGVLGVIFLSFIIAVAAAL